MVEKLAGSRLFRPGRKEKRLSEILFFKKQMFTIALKLKWKYTTTKMCSYQTIEDDLILVCKSSKKIYRWIVYFQWFQWFTCKYCLEKSKSWWFSFRGVIVPKAISASFRNRDPIIPVPVPFWRSSPHFSTYSSLKNCQFYKEKEIVVHFYKITLRNKNVKQKVRTVHFSFFLNEFLRKYGLKHPLCWYCIY